LERVEARDANKPNASSERVKYRVRSAITFSGIHYSVQESLQSQLLIIQTRSDRGISGKI